MEQVKKSTFLWSIVLLTLLIISIGAFYFSNSKSIVEDQYIEGFSRSVKQLDASINEFLGTFENALMMFSQNDMVRSVKASPDEYQVQVRALFKSFQQSYPYSAYAYYVVTEPVFDGRRVITWPDTSEALESSDWEPETRPWFSGAINARGHVAWTKPYEDATTGRMMVTASRAVYDDTETIQGVIAIDVFLDELSNKIDNFRAYHSGQAFLIDKTRDGYVLITQDQEKNTLGELVSDKWMQELKKMDQDIFEVEFNETSYYATAVENSTAGWYVIGIIESRKVYEETMRVLKDVLLSTAFVLSIGLGSILYVSKQLTSSVRDIGHQIELRADVKKSDEESPLKEEFDKVLTNVSDIELKTTRNLLGILFDTEIEMERAESILHAAEYPGQTEDIDNCARKLLKLRQELLEEESPRRMVQVDQLESVLREIESKWDTHVYLQ